MNKKQLCSETVKMIREQRHDFINHFQVILGYLQLNKGDLAAQYIKQKNIEMEELSKLYSLENPYLVINLLLVFQKSQSLDIEFSFHMEQKTLAARNIDEAEVDELALIINLLLEMIKEKIDGKRWLDVTLKETNQRMDWFIACPSSLTYDDLMPRLNARLGQEKRESSITAEEMPDQTILCLRF